MKKRNTLLIVTVSVLFAFLSSSCIREEQAAGEDAVVFSEHTVSATCELLPSEEATRSSFTSTKTQIRSVQMFVYNHSTGAYVNNTYTDKGAGRASNGFDIDFMQSYIRDNVAYDFYFLVNLPKVTSGIPTTASAMDTYTYTFADYSSFNSYGFPMAAKYTNIILGQEPEKIYFKRLVSKWTVYCDYSQANNDLSLMLIAKSLRVRNAASSTQPFASSPAAPTVFDDSFGDSETDATAMSELTDEGVVLWVLENCSGRLLDDSVTADEDRKLSKRGTNNSLPTFLEFIMDGFTSEKFYSGNVYRYLLGTPSESGIRDINNFRNRDYYVQMYFTSTSLEGDGWYREVASSVDMDINDDAVVNAGHPSEKVKGIVINYLGETSFNLTSKAQSIIDRGISLMAEWSDGRGPLGSDVESAWYNLSDGGKSPYLGGVRNQPLLDVSINNVTRKLTLSPSDYLRNATQINPEDEDDGYYEPYIHMDDNVLNPSSPGSLNCIVNVKRTSSLYIDIKTTSGVLLTRIPVQLGPSHIRIYNKADDENPVDGMFDGITFDGGVTGNRNLGTYDFTYPVSATDYRTLSSRGNGSVVRNDNTTVTIDGSVTGVCKNFISTLSWMWDYSEFALSLVAIGANMLDYDWDKCGDIYSKEATDIVTGRKIYAPDNSVIHDYNTSISGSSNLGASEPFSSICTALSENYSNYVFQRIKTFGGVYNYLSESNLLPEELESKNQDISGGAGLLFRHHIYPVRTNFSMTFHSADMVCTGGESLIVANYLSGSGNASLSYLPTGRRGLKFRHEQDIRFFNSVPSASIGKNNQNNGLKWSYRYANPESSQKVSRATILPGSTTDVQRLSVQLLTGAIGFLGIPLVVPVVSWLAFECPADPSEDQWINVSMTYTVD